MNRIRLGLFVTLSVFVAGPAAACLWDYDTLAMEKFRFPDTLELISGRFLRHSKAYYEWRVTDRTERLQAKPGDPALTDDLAVAFDKLDRQDDAIQLMREQLETDPDRYETHANLGTFLIHRGDLAEGLKHVERAIEINPNAHFGREIFQAHLVRYVLQRRDAMRDGEPALPLRDKSQIESAYNRVGFAAYLQELAQEKDPEGRVDRKAAIKGVLGMMRFGHYDSPVLLETLGDLLAMPASDDAKRMASRAYLKASYETEGETSERYRKFADSALDMQLRRRGSQSELTLEEVERLLKQEIANGEEFGKQIEADEKAWIQEGKDVDALFHTNYYLAEQNKPELPKPLGPASFRQRIALLGLGISAAAIVLVGAAVVFFRMAHASDRAPKK